MPLDPTLGELSEQQQQMPPRPPEQLPPQMPWSQTPTGESVSGLGRIAGGALQGVNEWMGQRVQAAMRGGADEESVRAATDLSGLIFGGGIGGAERAALGVAGGRLFLKPNQLRKSLPGTKELILVDETGKQIGNVKAYRSNFNPKTLHVGWTGAEKGPWAAGTSEMLSFMTELQHEFPGIEKIQASRVSGARKGPASSGSKGAGEITIPAHRRIAPGTPRDPAPEPGTAAPITGEREKQWRERNKYERMFTPRTRGENVPYTPPATAVRPNDPRSNLPPIEPPSLPPPPPPPEGSPQHQSLEDMMRSLLRGF